MTTREITSICNRHGIPAKYRIHFFNLVNEGHASLPGFGRMTRRVPKFRACLEEMLDVLSEPFKKLFEPTHFESMEECNA